MKASMKPNSRRSLLAAVATTLLCVSAAAEPLALDPQVARENGVAPAAAHARSVKLAHVSSVYVSGDEIGEIRTGPGCDSSTPREWSELIRQRVEAELPKAFAQEMAQAEFAAGRRAGAADALEVRAIVNKLGVHACNLGEGAWRGGFEVQVSWQVVRRGTKRTVYQASSTGSSNHESAAASLSSAAVLREAFAVSVRNLFADRHFAALVHLTDHPDQHLADAGRY
jgi:hypothetical protein